MSYDKEDTSTIENDMVEESHVRKVKKDAYHVASSDGLGLIITTVQLKENNKDNNYTEWRKAICLALPIGGANSGAQRTALGGTGRGWTNAGRNGRGWANAAAGLYGCSSGTASINSGHDSGGNSNGSNKFGNFPNLSHEQWSKLLTLLDTSNPTQTDALSGMETL
ncbi:hypothetical protein M9H77_22409 [Catharanthus roseus]|uniref:Uncharacterized protein n=1 Tax=Catharanthus roseus TaxID=4058 RepID=A0ACC0AQT3_CATRO|nr:hypothetical protein M9H77_22409 [Catharanthus roseus]